MINKSLIFATLCCRLDIGMEDVYFSEGFQHLAENLPGEEFAYPASQAGLEPAQDHKGQCPFNIVTIVASHLVTDPRRC